MEEIRKLLVAEHFSRVGFIFGMRWVSKKTGAIVTNSYVVNYIKTGVLK
ncbi:MAG: hypothetical protein U9N33_08175 [Campylobacterota bacterium]|nr:hypothetical protein [Campylobacterota bacterium]